MEVILEGDQGDGESPISAILNSQTLCTCKIYFSEMVKEV